MNKRIFPTTVMLVMSCLLLAQGAARDPKTGRFIKKTHMSAAQKPHASAAWNAAHPRDPKTGRFIKRPTMTPMHGLHSMPMRNSKTGRFMSAHPGTGSFGAKPPLHTMRPAGKKPGMMSKIKSMFSKKH